MKRFLQRLALPALAVIAAFHSTGTVQAQNVWSEQTTAAAMGYCLASHPFVERDPANPYTAEGFEIPPSPGIVGAVRRNFVMARSSPDDGQKQTCQQACEQMGQLYAPSLKGRTLNYRSSSGTIMANGIGDLASLVMKDSDIQEPSGQAIAGLWGRPLNYHEDDVAQADLCCCTVDTP